MPSFGRLGKHSNRSQQLIAESLAAGGAGGAGGANRASPSAGAGAGSTLQHPADANTTAATPHSALSSSHNTTAFSSSESFDSRTQPPPQQQQQQHSLQSQRDQQLPPSSPSAAPPHLYSSPSAASSSTSANPPPLRHDLNPGAGLGGSPVFDGQHQHQHPQHQQQQQQQQQQLQYQNHPDFADSGVVSRSSQQSNRFSTIAPQSTYGVAVDSGDDLGNTINYGPGSAPLPPVQQLQQQPPAQQQGAPAPEKRSTRKLIKGIFSGSSRGASDQPHHHGISIGHSHQHSYDNTSGLARRPSKRVSTQPPSIKTTFSQVGQQPQTPTDRPGPAAQSAQAQAQFQAQSQGQDWQQQQQQQNPPQGGYLPNPSPLHNVGEVEEYYTTHESNHQSPSQNSRVSLTGNNTIRQVSNEVEPSYEDVAYRPHQQQAPPSHQQPQVHPQDQQQQPRYDTGAYDQTSPQNPSNSQHQSPQQQYPYTNPQQQAQYQQGGDPRILATHLGPSQQQNPETVSQFSHESPITDSDQRSANLASASTSPAVKHSAYVENQGPTPSLPPVQQTTVPPQQTQQQPGMAPPGGGPPPSRRPQDAEKALRGQVDPPAGPPPAYRHSAASMNTMNPLPPVPPQAGGQQPTYRGDRPAPFEGQAAGDQGRNSPQPSTNTESGNVEDGKQFKDLLTKYKNVKRLYFDGKSQIEVLNGQVEQLQNAVANQRMSQSRTVLDDNEYSTRFNRLNGAINNLSFNIRKDWRSVPQWLENFVSAEALKTGRQEMTAIGRAVISRWLVEEIFNKCFHPGLDPQLSQHLKEIELSIRHNAYTMSSQEEFEALTQKVVSWRMTTLEGLNRQLSSPATVENRNLMTEKATSNLTACLFQYLNDPPPTGVQGSTSMIVELAIGIANNLPLESRDVAVFYPLPGDMVQPHLMEVEKTPLPVLEAQKTDAEGEGEEDTDKDKNGKSRPDKAKTALLPKDTNKVRFAGFIALEVRGRQVLMKAPVWTL